MSRRTREGQRLAEDVAVVINRAGGKSMVSRAEARRIKAEQEQEERERRASSMRVLLFRQYAPWLAAFGVLILGGVEWLVRWLDGAMVALTVASLIGLALAWAAWMVGRRTKRWRGRIHLAAGIASAWLLLAAAAGPSWRAVLVLVLGTVLSSSSWWQANRPPHPKAPSPVAVPVRTEASIPVLWAENLGAHGAVLAGSLLSDPDSSRTNCESYTVKLRPGKQTITGTIAQLELIAGGLFTPVKHLVLEPHEDENPTHLKLTIVKVSPIDKTLSYSGARIVGEQRNALEVGPYGDGDGWARWRMWDPGEKPMTGSWLSGSVIAGTGIGKSRLMELLAAGYMASGNAVVWFVDPQGGASSPALQEYADWYVSSEGVGRMLSALEAIAKAREAENSQEKWSRFDPTPERPGIVVFLDECHVTIERYAKRLEDLARKTQKVGISFVGLTQGASLESLGKDILRACLTANLIVMKTGSNQTKNLLPGLTVNPEMLPKIPGFGYTIGESDGSRTAPFRSEYVADPEHWFKRYSETMPKLDPMSANAAGAPYLGRSEAAAAEVEKNRRWVEQLRAGAVQPALDDEQMTQKWVEGARTSEQWALDAAAEATRNETEAEERIEQEQGRAFHVVQFPSSPAARPQDATGEARYRMGAGRTRVLLAVGNGITRTDEIQKAVALSKSQTAAVLKQLVEEEHLIQVTRGVYSLATAATPPVR